MEIIINNPKEVVVVPEKRVMLSKITVLNISDHPDSKIVTAFTHELGIIILWQNEDYDAIGQWTDTDVVNRINQIYNQ